MSSFSHSSSTNVPRSTDENDPVFQSPWEAHAFAIVHQLAEDKHYSWSEWTAQFAAIIGDAERQSPGDTTYYESWVHACETLLASKGLLNEEEINQKIDEILAQREQEHQH
jgi:nitrile hydratase accessory protein